MIEIVSATRLAESEFWKSSALGRSLRRLAFDTRLVPRIAFANTRGLPEVFNARILATDSAPIMVFVHDDVWLDDYFLADRVRAGLAAYDVIGVAGNRRRLPMQPAWPVIDDTYTWDADANLSGCLAHGAQAFGDIVHFGAVPAECELLDGVFLAANKASLARGEVRFDPRFDFHMYDLDFCRSARAAGLRLGTWPICLTHQSGGAFGSAPWREKLAAYREKWGS